MFREGLDEFGVGCVEFGMTVNHQSQRYLDTQVWGSGDSSGLEFYLSITQI